MTQRYNESVAQMYVTAAFSQSSDFLESQVEDALSAGIVAGDGISEIQGMIISEGGQIEPDELLIDLVRDRPWLYDKSRPDRKDAVAVQNGWQAIAEIIYSTGRHLIWIWFVIDNH